MRLFIGTGTQGFRPEGYTTVDISPEHHPDIVADASDLSMLASGSADELYASHVLEHFPFPRALLVLAEWARVIRLGGTIRIAVPDMEIYAHFLLNGHNPFVAMTDIYGAHWPHWGEDEPQAHHFGYTRRMLTQILAVMGFKDFDFWRSHLPEAANTWTHGENQERVGVSLNLSGIKNSGPLLDITTLCQRLRNQKTTESFMVTVRQSLIGQEQLTGLDEIDAVLFQKLNFKYLEAQHLAEFYETKYKELLARPPGDAGFTERGGSSARNSETPATAWHNRFRRWLTFGRSRRT